jgi:hypothetical protein
VQGLPELCLASHRRPAFACHPQELDHPEFGHYFVKRALATALDKHDREREMTSVLLSTLYSEVSRRVQARIAGNSLSTPAPAFSTKLEAELHRQHAAAGLCAACRVAAAVGRCPPGGFQVTKASYRQPA